MCSGGPCNEEDLALAAVVDGDEIEVEDGVAAIVFGQRGGEFVVTFSRTADLIDGDKPRSFIDLEDDESVNLLPLHLHERVLALIRHPHSSSRLLTTINHTPPPNHQQNGSNSRSQIRDQNIIIKVKKSYEQYHLESHRHVAVLWRKPKVLCDFIFPFGKSGLTD